MNISLIRMARTIQGWTQAQLAEKLNIDRTTLSRVETGFVIPGPELRKRIADVLRMPAEVLFADCLGGDRMKPDMPDTPKKEECTG